MFGFIENDEVHLSRVGEIIENTWIKIPLHFPYVEVDAFVVMPNHFHGIIIINDVVCARHVVAQHKVSSLRRQASPLPENKNLQPQPLWVIVRSFKSAVTKRIHDLGLLS
jgi:REP element-mobilizing transposase RayT